jgi:hypothetical protein
MVEKLLLLRMKLGIHIESIICTGTLTGIWWLSAGGCENQLVQQLSSQAGGNIYHI